VSFRVDAYATERFTGTVEQVRLQPTVVQNVVVYSTVIAVPNPQLKLKPGMTAQVEIEIARRNNVLRVPTAALRFRPTELMFQALNQEVPQEILRGGRGGTGMAGRGGRGRDGGAGQPAAGAGAPPAATTPGAAAPPAAAAQSQAQPPRTAPQGAPSPGAGAARPESAEARGGGDRAAGGGGGGRGGFDPNMTPEERRKRMEERLASMSPEERERFQARMREREAQGGQPGTFGRDTQGGGRGNQPGQPAPGAGRAQSGRDPSRGIAGSVSAGTSITSGASTIDSLFAPLPAVETRGRVWLYIGKQLKSVNLRLGVTDGTFSELLDGALQENQEVVLNMVTGLEPVTRPGQQGGSQNPLMGPQRGGPGGRGPGGGGRGF
jgi:hypothetical protein